MFSFLLTNIKTIITSIGAFILYFVLQKNKKLKVEKEILQNNLDDQLKINKIQERVLNECKDIDNLDSDERIKRLQQYKQN
jgi:hypothetical protein